MMTNNSDVFLRAVCGALGSVVSMTLLYPLETLRTRLQIDSTFNSHHRKNTAAYQSSLHLIYFLYKAEGGLSALYRGWASLVLALSVTNFVYFYSFHGLRDFVNGDGQQQEQVISTDFFCGIVAGVLTVLASNPFWVINIRLKLQCTKAFKDNNTIKIKRKNNNRNDNNLSEKDYYHGIIHCFLTIIQEQGMSSLWLGTTSSLILVFNPTIQFVTYEALKRWDWLGVVATPLLGVSICLAVNSALAKMIATIVTYPLQVIQTRCGAGLAIHGNNKKSKNKRSNTIWIQIRMIMKQNNNGGGIRGLFCGLESKLLQTSLTAAIMFFVYEKLVTAIKLYL